MAAVNPYASVETPTGFLRALGYGGPGKGKSRVFCSTPVEWGKVLLLGFDPHAFDSVPTKVKANVIHQPIPINPLIRPGVNDPRRPDLALFAATMTNWKEVYPEVGVVVVDTLSVAAQGLLQYYANAGTGIRDHTTIQTPAGLINRPADSDYGDAQNQVMAALKFIYDKPYHFLFLCHEDVYEERAGDVVTVKGGPATVGRKLTGKLAGHFTPTLYFAARNLGQRLSYRVHTEHTGIWQAKVASPHGTNPMPMLEIPADDPGLFWREYQTKFMTEVS